ncbi:unnamed protein product [Clonostachys rosea f. rosea IK726]|uniref:Uncharacterized protein n=1 Tax=Clonostachys rosea f. rosea IK726 TaxID=1349383 RepID=A0ACA9UIY7_BIOOC|nr:unnamed protein product [Clonostachys rosea f. rosea IK726]
MIQTEDKSESCLLPLRKEEKIALILDHQRPELKELDHVLTKLWTANMDFSSRLMLAQDHHEIYIIVATFDDDYVRYITHQHTTTMSFLEMEQYGPFPVDSYIQMFYLSRIMLAYSMNGGIQ